MPLTTSSTYAAKIRVRTSPHRQKILARTEMRTERLLLFPTSGLAHNGSTAAEMAAEIRFCQTPVERCIFFVCFYQTIVSHFGPWSQLLIFCRPPLTHPLSTYSLQFVLCAFPRYGYWFIIIGRQHSEAGGRAIKMATNGPAATFLSKPYSNWATTKMYESFNIYHRISTSVPYFARAASISIPIRIPLEDFRCYLGAFIHAPRFSLKNTKDFSVVCPH